MASHDLKLDIDNFILASKVRITAVLRQSVQDVIDKAQTTTSAGGHMRVDTGFLRASGQASLNGMPTGPTRGERSAPGSYTWNPQNVTVTIGQLEPGGAFFFGWTAAYAGIREVYDGFLGTAVQSWDQIVARNADEVRNRISMNAASTYQRGG